MFVPNKNYCDFETFLTPIVRKMARRIKEDGTVFSPS